MGIPHHLDMRAMGRAVCGGDLVGDQLDDVVIELEAVVEVGSQSG